MINVTPPPDDRVDLLMRLRDEQQSDRAQVQALTTRMEARNKVLAGLRDLLALEGRLPPELVEEERRFREMAVQARADRERRMREMEAREREVERPEREVLRRTLAPMRRPDLVQAAGGTVPVEPETQEPRGVADLDRPDEQAQEPEQPVPTRRMDTVKHVTQIVRERGPIDRAGIRREFEARGWTSEAWKSPTNTIGNAILRARDRDKTIIQTDAGFVAAESIPAQPEAPPVDPEHSMDQLEAP